MLAYSTVKPNVIGQNWDLSGPAVSAFHHSPTEASRIILIQDHFIAHPKATTAISTPEGQRFLSMR